VIIILIIQGQDSYSYEGKGIDQQEELHRSRNGIT
jgi:hypothetical protein